LISLQKSGGKKEFKMKNFWKIFGIIALVAIIGFSMLACEEKSSDDDDTTGTDTTTPDTNKPGVSGAETDGTWVGDATNGTLVISGNKFTSPDPTGTKANILAASITNSATAATIGVGDGKITITVGGAYTQVAFLYTVSGNTLTISTSETANPPNEVKFTGTKQ
jgi:hypothetical protein